MNKPGIIFILAILLLTIPGMAQEGWTDLFNGESLDGWKASENPDSFTVEDGAIVCAGPRAHLFYMGEDGKARAIRNSFLLAAFKEVMDSLSSRTARVWLAWCLQFRIRLRTSP